MKLGSQSNYHKGRAALRHFATQLANPVLPNAQRLFSNVVNVSVLNVKAQVVAFNQEKP